jgi:hypothetical protein
LLISRARTNFKANFVPIAKKRKEKKARKRWDGLFGENQVFWPTKNISILSGKFSNLPLKSLEKIPESLSGISSELFLNNLTYFSHKFFHCFKTFPAFPLGKDDKIKSSFTGSKLELNCLLEIFQCFFSRLTFAYTPWK